VKKEIGTVDATPTKRIFYSIIADYDLNRSICELVDNGLDVWVRSKRAKPITIKIDLDNTQQTIRVEDDAGGLPKADLRFIVGPGETGTVPTDQTIGIFGVGTKRAVVALAQDIKITTRCPGEGPHQIAFDDAWINDPSWELPVYEGEAIAEGTTIVELHRLRAEVTDESVNLLRDHLQATYAHFIARWDVKLELDGEALVPRFFKNWAYPPKYEPRHYTGQLTSQHGSV
jgi:Histidine kinase-, DNA gyrase B-, and HSP90-like ATPase